MQNVLLTALAMTASAAVGLGTVEGKAEDAAARGDEKEEEDNYGGGGGGGGGSAVVAPPCPGWIRSVHHEQQQQQQQQHVHHGLEHQECVVSLEGDVGGGAGEEQQCTPVAVRNVICAYRRLCRNLRRTPFYRNSVLSNRFHCHVLLKLENLQRTGSFKSRGALNKILEMMYREGDRVATCKGFICASAGNHAAGVAAAAQFVRVPALILVPDGTPAVKVQNCSAMGAIVEVFGNSFDVTAAEAKRRADMGDYILVHPFNDPIIIAGQGTVAVEMLQDTGRLVVDELLFPRYGDATDTDVDVDTENEEAAAAAASAAVASPVAAAAAAAAASVAFPATPVSAAAGVAPALCISTSDSCSVRARRTAPKLRGVQDAMSGEDSEVVMGALDRTIVSARQSPNSPSVFFRELNRISIAATESTHGVSRRGSSAAGMHNGTSSYSKVPLIDGHGVCNMPIDILVVPVGGGGLISGMSVVFKHYSPRTRVVGVVAERAKGCIASLASEDGPIKAETTPGLADGLKVGSIGAVTHRIMRALVDEVVVVREEEIAVAVACMLSAGKVVAEGAGAVPLAALMSGRLGDVRGKRVALVITGGNIDLSTIVRCLTVAGVVPEVGG